VIGKLALLFAMVSAMLSLFAQEPRKGTDKVMYYELYSWQEPNGNWDFSLLPSTSREKTVREVVGKENRIEGVEQLEKRISELPEGSTVVALGRLPTGTGPKAKGSENLTYPPKKFVRELQSSGEPHKITIDVYSGDGR